MKPRLVALAVAAPLALLLAVALAWVTGSGAQPEAGDEAAETPSVTIHTTAKIGGPFELVAHTGETVRDTDFRGSYMLLTFGYTYCPDVCPTLLQMMAVALDELGDQAEAVQPLFVSVDPDRDTPEVLATYVSMFHPRIIGLTGTPEQIAQAAREYRVSYGKTEIVGEGNTYFMSHSIFIYLMDPDGRFLTIFWPDTDPKEIAVAIRGYLAQSP